MANLQSTVITGDLTLETLNIKWDSTVVTNNTPSLFNLLYPVGSIFMSVSQIEETKDITNKAGCPLAEYFGKWRKVADGRALIGTHPNSNSDDSLYTENDESKRFLIATTGGKRDLTTLKHSHYSNYDSVLFTELNEASKRYGNMHLVGINHDRNKIGLAWDGTIINIDNGYRYSNHNNDNAQSLEDSGVGYRSYKNYLRANHSHTLPTITIFAESGRHNGIGYNMQPYYVVYMWERLPD